MTSNNDQHEDFVVHLACLVTINITVIVFHFQPYVTDITEIFRKLTCP